MENENKLKVKIQLKRPCHLHEEMGDSRKMICKQKEKHVMKFFKKFLEYKKNGKFCDVILKLHDDTEIPAHRNVLASTIPLFEAMFKENNEKIVKVEGIHDPHVFDSIINYCYGAQIEINQENVEKLLNCAEYLQIKYLKPPIEKFLKTNLSLENVLKTKRLAKLQNLSKLISAIKKFIDDNFSNFASTEEFLEMKSQELIEIIKRDELRVSEDVVYESVIKWIKFAAPDRMPLLAEVFSNVRFCLLSPEYLVDIVRNENLIQNSPECKHLLEESICYHLMSSRRELPETIQNRPRQSALHSIYIIGGTSYEKGALLDIIQIYNPEKDEWSTDRGENSMDLKANLASSAVIGKKLYVIGGDLEDSSAMKICDFKTKTITQGKKFPKDSELVSVAALNDSIYLCGFDTMSDSSIFLKYSPSLDSWTELTPFKQKRCEPGVVSLNNHIYAIGGDYEGSSSNVCERFCPDSATWEKMPSMLTAKSRPGVAVLNGKIYVCGGMQAEETSTSSSEVFDPDTNEWTNISSMNVERCDFALISYNGKLYAFGGYDDSIYSPEDSSEVYDPLKNTWNFIAPMLKSCHGMCFGLIPN